jgi:hypothetical protein
MAGNNRLTCIALAVDADIIGRQEMECIQRQYCNLNV